MSVTPANVQALIRQLDPSIDISWAISDAVTFAGVILPSTTTPAMVDMIVKYIAAHFVILNIERGGLIRDTMGTASQQYVDPSGFGLKSSRYGQMAITLDTSGCLASAATEKKLLAQIKVSSACYGPLDSDDMPWPGDLTSLDSN